MKSIQEYLPKKIDTTLVQARVPKELAEKVKEFMDQNNLSWSDLVRACFEKLVDDETREEKRKVPYAELKNGNTKNID